MEIAAIASSLETESEEFDRIISKLADTCHGCAAMQDLRELFDKRIDKTSRREAFLLNRLLQNPVRWIDVKNRLWIDESDQIANRYSFLQGDVIESRLVYGLEGQVDHDRWMILSVDCDAVRSSFVRVGTAVQILKTTPRSDLAYQKFAAALKFKNSKYFSIPRLPGDDANIVRGYVIDLETPFYLDFRERPEDRELVTQLASLTVPAWHLLNAILVEGSSRANLTEGSKLREWM